MSEDFDDIVIGSGMAGLTVGALLAKAGRRVLLLEAHDTPGGYAHSFQLRDYRFCAQVHYIFNCGEGEKIHALLSSLGLAEAVPFVRLDVEGFDHVVIGDERLRIPNGWAKFRDRMIARYPAHEAPLRAYFRILADVAEGLDQLPDRLSLSTLRAACRYRHVVRYLRSTLEDVYDQVRMPARLRALLAGQCGDYLLPPRDVSFLLHVALVFNYDRGAYYPRDHFFHFVDAIAGIIRGAPGCKLLLGQEVDRIEVAAGKGDDQERRALHRDALHLERRPPPLRVVGTPATNERYCWAPEGNSYGAALTPRNIGIHRKPWRAGTIDNLWLANATAGFPSVAGAIGAGMRLFGELS